MEKKTLWQKIYPWLGFRFCYEYEGRIKYRVCYWVSKKFWLFTDVVGTIADSEDEV